MKTRFLLIGLILLLIHSCMMDPVLLCELCNESKDTIRVKLEFDTNYLKEIKKDFSPKTFSDLPFPHIDSNVIVLQVDSIKYAMEILIKPYSRIMMDAGINNGPNMYFSRLKLYHKKDIIIVQGSENINKAFINEHGYTYRLKIN